VRRPENPEEEDIMKRLRRIFAAMTLAATVGGVGSVLGPTTTQAATLVPTPAPAQFYGPSGWPGGFYAGAGLFSPYAGSASYPYYRYGAAYGSAFGLPYPTYQSSGAYYGGPVSTAYPSYSSAGGVLYGESWGGYYPSFGRCIYSASAGYGGSWTDPLSYGYYAPDC